MPLTTPSNSLCSTLLLAENSSTVTWHTYGHTLMSTAFVFSTSECYSSFHYILFLLYFSMSSTSLPNWPLSPRLWQLNDGSWRMNGRTSLGSVPSWSWTSRTWRMALRSTLGARQVCCFFVTTQYSFIIFFTNVWKELLVCGHCFSFFWKKRGHTFFVLCQFTS